LSAPENRPDRTHFGYQTIPVEEKETRVRSVFDSVAARYDLMNDLMSGGVHRLWKRFTVEQAALRPGHVVLDLAGGTGDLAAAMAPRVAPEGRVVLADINESMLRTGRTRLDDRGLTGRVAYALANAEELPFPDASFDVVTIAFGLRNVTRKDKALREMARVLRPGGQALVLEFSRPVVPGLKPVYDLYSFKILPALGSWVAGDSDSYRYLAESIRMHPDQETLREMMETAGLEGCRYHNLTGGIVALHRGYRY
jgi:demethylmenaquinone methyltransferase/2-methoxy-6-polyprenyl-1,4-benzoquinol methylase